MIRFDQPWWLLGILFAPLLFFALRNLPPSIRFSNTHRLRGSTSKSYARQIQMFLRAIAVVLLLVGLSRPQWGFMVGEQKSSGVDVMLVVDVSGSMEALDFKLNGKAANRLAVVKNVISQFIEERTSDRIGIVAFAGRPYLVSPLTLDHDWLLQQFDRLQIGMVEDGTAIGAAIASGVSRMVKQQSKGSKVLVLLTDGVNNAGQVDPLTAAQAAAALGIKIYAVGAGTMGRAPMPATNMWGQKTLVMVDVQVDEAVLQEVAKISGGRYFRATDTESLRRIYNEINQMEKIERTAKRFQAARELFMWLVLPAFGLIVLEAVLMLTLWRRLP